MQKMIRTRDIEFDVMLPPTRICVHWLDDSRMMLSTYTDTGLKLLGSCVHCGRRMVRTVSVDQV